LHRLEELKAAGAPVETFDAIGCTKALQVPYDMHADPFITHPDIPDAEDQRLTAL
jgi:hypothetical protein